MRQVIRARLEGRAKAAGLRVTGAVSRKTAVLVTDGADTTTTKAQSARQLSTRIVTPDVFAELVTYIQPADPETAVITTASIPLSRTEPDPTPTATFPSGL